MAEQGAPIRWRFWIGWGLAVLVVVLFAGHAVWTSMTASRMNRKIEALKQAGEPMMPADFDVTNFNSPDNAGLDIDAAGRLINTQSVEWQEHDKIEWALPLREDERKVLEAFAASTAPALQRLEAARGKTRVEWDVRFAQPTAGFLFTGAGEVRNLGTALLMHAALEHERGNDRAAMDRIEQALFVARYPDRHPSLVGHLVSVGIERMTATWAVQIAPNLRIGPGPNEVPPAGLRRIIDRLLDDGPATEGLIRGLRGERMMEVEVVRMVVSGAPMPGWGVPGSNLHPAARYFIRPVYFRAGSRMIDNVTAVLKAAEEKSWPAVRAKLPLFTSPNSILEQAEMSMMPSLNRYMEMHYQTQTERRLAAVALAVRWYALEHDGRLPATLQDLVPTYLPNVPIDPQDAKFGPLLYKPAVGAPIVYSVGHDGADDGGDEAVLPTIRHMRRPPQPWEMKDRVQRLFVPVRPPPPSTNESGG